MIFCFLVGVVLSVVGFTRPIVIKFSYVKFMWTEAVLVAFSSFLCAFLFEYVVLTKLAVTLDEYTGTFAITMLKSALSNGFLIPFFSALISLLFGFVVESLNLDYHKLYSKLVAKVCFSAIIFPASFKMLFILYKEYSAHGGEINNQILNRIIIWLITAVGIWFGFGCKCDGRINAENKKRMDCKNDISIKEYLGFWVPIVISLVVCVLCLFFMDSIYIATFAQKFTIPITASFSLGFLITVFVLKAFLNPGEWLSKINFYSKFRTSQIKKNKKFRFGKMRCELGVDSLHIEKTNVQYPGHEDDKEFIKIFGEDNIDYNNGKDEILKKLLERREKQNKYIADAFKGSRNEKADSLLVPLDSGN